MENNIGLKEKILFILEELLNNETESIEKLNEYGNQNLLKPARATRDKAMRWMGRAAQCKETKDRIVEILGFKDYEEAIKFISPKNDTVL